MRTVQLTALLLTLAPALLTAQSDPPARFLGATAYDQSRHRVVLFGGLGSGDRVLDDTWEWDGSAWKKLSLEVSPPARAGHAMAFDPVHRVILMFGGAGDEEPLNDLWAFNGAWRKLTVAESPGARLAAMMYWNPDRKAIQLLGGRTMTGQLNDFWEWNGTKWTMLRGSTEAAATVILDEPRDDPAASPLESMVKADLRNYVVAQEVFFADNNRYATSLAQLEEAAGYHASSGVTIELLSASSTSHAANAKHTDVPAGLCVIYVGDRPMSFPGDLQEGTPNCSGF